MVSGFIAGLAACGDDGGSGAPNGTGDAGTGPGDIQFGGWSTAFDASEIGWLLSAWGPSEDDVFAVGGPPGDGVIMHRAGGVWSDMDLPDGTPTVNWAYGFGPDDAWAVGDGGTALHYDGDAWRRVPTPTDQNLWGVWGAAPDDLWAVGGGTTPPSESSVPTVLRWDGGAWSSVGLPDLIPSRVPALFKVWGTSADDVLIVGSNGVILRWDGAALVQDVTRPVDHTDDYISLWGTGPDRVVVVGGRSRDQIAVWDGETWSDVPLARPFALNGIWMGRPDVFYTVGVRGIVATVRLAPAARGGLEGEVVQQTQVPGLDDIALHAVFGTPAGQLISVGGNFADLDGPHRGAAVVANIKGAAP